MRAFALFFVGLAACDDGFKGSNLEIDFTPATAVQAPAGVTPTTGQVAANGHFTLYGIQNSAGGDVMFEVQQFEIHKVVDLQSPCYIDVPPHVPHPGLHVSQYAAQILKDTGITDIANPPAGATEQQKITAATALQRDANVKALDSGLKAVTSASSSSYPAVAADCNGAPDLIPPPTCTDDASNQRRLTVCQAAWKADPFYYEGTDRVLTSPMNGTPRGFVDGMNPVNQSAVGGAGFYVDDNLVGLDSFAIYFKLDTDATKTAGDLVLFGTPTPTVARGVLHVHMTGANAALTAELSVFQDLGDEDVHF